MVPEEFGNLHALERLDVVNCVRLEKVPDSFAKLAFLKTLSLVGCENLIEVVVEFGICMHWKFYIWRIVCDGRRCPTF